MERVLVAVAWPYANGPLHLGHVAGAYLPADIFARYHRAKGNRVLMVSGSDQHGTPITITAEQEGKTPREIAAKYHAGFLDCWRRLGISFDLFTSTGTANHARVVHDFFLKLLERGCIYRDKMPLPYCAKCQRYLPDRYVEGTCPFCGFTESRGDQCDKCGKPLGPLELGNPRCRLCGSPPRTEDSEHFFLKLLEKGYIYRDKMPLPYCAKCQRYLPDRYVEGTCPFCGFTESRGDQCDKCGKPLGPLELGNPRCRLCGSPPRTEDSEHFFLRLSAFGDQLLDWVRQRSGWRQNVLNFTQRYLEEGLKDRAITRDIEWGIPIPQPGFEKKRIYVWFEAVIGYLSASKEWAGARGDDGGWADYWQGEAKSYYFIGKDNIPFHTMIWPAMLMGYGGLNLPSDVPANEFLTIEGRKLSTSRKWAVWLPDYLERYAPDPLRYLLSANMPESADADFSWREFVRRNNDELVATYGNLVHRVMTFTHRHFDGCVPEPAELDAVSNALLRKAESTLAAVDESLAHCRFREAVRAAMSLAQETNRYLDEKSPWKTVKTDREACATALFVSFSAISCLKTVLAPFLPFSSQKLHAMLGGQGEVAAEGWALHPVRPGQRLGAAETLFTKLDEAVVAAESSRLGNGQG